MTCLGYSARLGRKIRQDPVDRLGRSTFALAEEAIGRGDGSGAAELIQYMRFEYLVMYAFLIGWKDDLVEYIAGQWGAAARGRALRETRERYFAVRPQQREWLTPRERAVLEARLDRLQTGSEDPSSLGAEAEAAALAALAAGRAEDARRELEAIWREYLVPHDFLVAWVHDLLALVAELGGEDAVPGAIRLTYERRWKARYALWAAMGPKERLELTVEGMRGHLSGHSRKGDVEVGEESDRYVVRFLPCGSGGILLTGDPVTGAPPYRPEAANRQPHPWTWQRTGVLWYSTHCPTVMEWFTALDLGYPMRPVEYMGRAGRPCTWFIYKRPELTRPEHLIRLGLKGVGRGGG
jgi:hypothetical protein